MIGAEELFDFSFILHSLHDNESVAFVRKGSDQIIGIELVSIVNDSLYKKRSGNLYFIYLCGIAK